VKQVELFRPEIRLDTSSNPWPLAGGLITLCLAVLLGGGAFVFAHSSPEKVTAPTTFSTFQANDKSFQCEYPSDWHKRSGESQAIASMASFERGNARIEVTADLAGSLMGDMPAPGAGLPDLSQVPGAGSLPGLSGLKMDTRPAVERLHEADKKETKLEVEASGFSEYDEDAPQKFECRMGDARSSTFHAKGGFLTGNLKGIRATIMGPERAVKVICRAPEKDWDMLQPAFQRVLKSIAPPGA
jgi:hypothetical protein